MRRGELLLLSAILSMIFAGCDAGGDRAPATAARPAMDVPVGPPPGPDPALLIRSNPFSGSAVALTEGRRYFVWFNCAGCHGDHAGGGMGPSLRDPEWLYGNSDAQIFASIAQGRAHGMPAWGTKLPEDVIWSIVSYIQVLETPREPSPPPANPSWPRPGVLSP